MCREYYVHIDAYLAILIDHVDAARLVAAAAALAEIRVQRRANHHVVQIVAVHVTHGDGVAKVGTHLQNMVWLKYKEETHEFDTSKIPKF